MGKNLLSDTDYTKGWDNRFGVSVCVGKVSKIEVSEKGANVRVTLPDRVDHTGQPLITKPIPVLMVASQSKKTFAVPRLDTNVLLVKLPNGTSNYMVVGSYYTSKDPPPVTDPKLDYVIYDDGSTMQFNSETGELTWKLKGDMLIDNEASLTIKLDEDFTLEPDGNIDIHAKGDTDIKSDGDTVIEAANVTIRGNITLDGQVHTTRNMQTDGIHRDSIGLHTGAVIGDSEEWRWTSDTLDASSAGQVGVNATSWPAVTQINLSMITNDGRDMTPILDSIIAGNELRLQAKADSTRFGLYKVMGAAAPSGGWWAVPVELLVSGGMVPANNALTIVTLVQPAVGSLLYRQIAALEARIAQLEAQRNG